MDILQHQSPTCQSPKMTLHTTYITQAHGQRTIWRSTECETYFSEIKNTVLEGLRTPLSKIWEVLNARTEGMGLNATARVFHTGKQTIINWERRFEVRCGGSVRPFDGGPIRTPNHKTACNDSCESIG